MTVLQYFGMAAAMNSPTILLKFAGIRKDSSLWIPLVRNCVLIKPRKSIKSSIAFRICPAFKPYGMAALGLNPSARTGMGVQAPVSLSDILALLRAVHWPRASILRNAIKSRQVHLGLPSAALRQPPS